MTTIRKKSRISEKAENDILQRIHSGELPVGSKLPSEPELAGTLGISRGSLREALLSLQNKGYISRSPRGGSYIRRNTDNNIGESITVHVQNADLAELIELREAIETKVVQYVIDRASDEEIESLRKVLTDNSDGGNTDYYFHYHLAELSGNHLFVVFLDMYYDTITRFAQRSYTNVGRTHTMNLEHKRVIDAVARRDKRAAVQAVKSHLHNVLRRVSEDNDADI